MELNKSKVKFNKIFILHCAALTFLVILYACVLSAYKGSIFGSTTDWLSQHSVIPEYFRQKFYETGDLLTRFSFNLGAGQNSFNFVYHGYLNPIILISYLLPFVPMQTYVICSALASVAASLILFYYWLSKKGVSPTAAFFSSLLFLFSTSVMYHAHKQVMFINYMPFLQLALLGVDDFIHKGRRIKLALGVLFMLLTNYFFSASGVLIITLYAVYEYLENNEGIRMGHFFKTGLSYALTLLSAALMSLVTLFPALLTILNGREKDATDAVNLAELLVPRFKISTMVYYGYGLGLTCICFIALIAFVFSRRKSRAFLACSVLILTSIPFVTCALNIFLYENTKVYITFIPVVCYMIAVLVEDIRSKSVNLRPTVITACVMTAAVVLLNLFKIYNDALYVGWFAADMTLSAMLLCVGYKYKNTKALMCFTLAAACCASVAIGSRDSLVSSELAADMYGEDKKEFISDCLGSEENFYRSSDLAHTVWSCNYVYSPKFYQTGLYSSIYNKNYNRFTHEVVNLANSTVNNISNTNSNDLLFSKLMGIKYIFAPDNTGVPYGYSLVSSSDGTNMYKNDSVYSVMFATDKLMSRREFDALGTAEKKAALLGYIIVDEDMPDVYTPVLHEVDIAFAEKDGEETSCPFDVAVEKGRKLYADVRDIPYDCYIVEVTLADLAEKKSVITVNGIVNAVSAHYNAFPKANKTFSFVVTSPDEIKSLDVSFKRGSYTVNSIKCYGFSYDSLDKMSRDITMSPDTKVIADNKMCGTIDMKKDGYINITVPYDESFSLYVDGAETEYEMTDSAFIGVWAAAGRHEVVLEYRTPGLGAGCVMFLSGVVMLAGLLIFDADRRKKANRIGCC